MVNRKLVRPNLAEVKNKLSNQPQAQEVARPNGHNSPRKRIAPPELTNAEAFYYLKQMNSQTPMRVVLTDGEVLNGHIEWYDRGCLKVHREDGPNVLVFKHSIKYLFKEEDA